MKELPATHLRPGTPSRIPLLALLAFVGAALVAGSGAMADAARQATSDPPQYDAGLARLNDALVQVERAFLDKNGLPGRTWFSHPLYAPGLTTG